MVTKRDFDYYGSNRPLHTYLREGRDTAAVVDEYLMGYTNL